MPDRIDRFVEALRPLSIERERAWWDAAVTGREADYRRLEESRNRIDRLHRDPALVADLEEVRRNGADPVARTRTS